MSGTRDITYLLLGVGVGEDVPSASSLICQRSVEGFTGSIMQVEC